MRLKHYLSCMLLLLVFAGVNAQEKKGELKAGDHPFSSTRILTARKFP